MQPKNLLSKKTFYFLPLLVLCTFSHARVENHARIESYASLWLSGVFIVPVVKNTEHWNYYFEPRFVILDHSYPFEGAHFYYGMVYKIASNFTPFIGGAFLISEDTQGNFSYENVIWEQFLWEIYKDKSVKVSNRSRLEERRNINFLEWASRLREQITLKFPIHDTKYSLVSSNEWFFNLNHPLWVSNKFFAQNRFYFGIEKQLNRTTSVNIGYINEVRFKRNPPNFLSNGLYLKIDVVG